MSIPGPPPSQRPSPRSIVPSGSRGGGPVGGGGRRMACPSASTGPNTPFAASGSPLCPGTCACSINGTAMTDAPIITSSVRISVPPLPRGHESLQFFPVLDHHHARTRCRRVRSPERVRRDCLREHLQGIVPFERGVMRPPHLAHSALANQGSDLIRTDAAA